MRWAHRKKIIIHLLQNWRNTTNNLLRSSKQHLETGNCVDQDIGGRTSQEAINPSGILVFLRSRQTLCEENSMTQQDELWFGALSYRCFVGRSRTNVEQKGVGSANSRRACLRLKSKPRRQRTKGKIRGNTEDEIFHFATSAQP